MVIQLKSSSLFFLAFSQIFFLLAGNTSFATSIMVERNQTNNLLSGYDSKMDADDLPNLFIIDSPDNKEHTTLAWGKTFWEHEDLAGARRQKLEEAYFANTKTFSNSGKRHVACFIGQIDEITSWLQENSGKIKIADVDQLYISVSEDLKMIGIEYEVLDRNKNMKVARHFRMPHCIQGAKAPLLTLEKIKVIAKTESTSAERMVASEKETKKSPSKKGRTPSNTETPTPAMKPQLNGYTQYDVVTKSALQKYEKSIKRKLPIFKIRADYAEFAKNIDAANPRKTRPWLGRVTDISKEGQAELLSQIVLENFYDSLLLDPKNKEMNLIAQNSPKDKSQWCHMPWLNVGDAGREAIHGLTKERDMESTAIYPETFQEPFLTEGGSNWGIGFYNDVACASLAKIFGSHDPDKKIAALDIPDFKSSIREMKDGVLTPIQGGYFPDGSVSVKVLFTTGKITSLDNSFTWTGNTTLPKQTARTLRPMRLLQIDVAIKDSSIKGTHPDAAHWIMLTYYFDENTEQNGLWNSPLRQDPRFQDPSPLAAFFKMRPVGIQWGFDTKTSRIFAGSKTNTTINQFHSEPVPGGTNPNLLNGPADNPTSSCLSCHGAAGTSTKMVPGVKDYEHYRKIMSKGSMDFSMQLAFAKRNYETKPKMTK